MAGLSKLHIPDVGLDSIAEVERLAPSLRNSKSMASLLTRYQPLDEKLGMLERVVEQVAIDWDRWVQHEIDVRRGK
jgi:hypothetical protein